MILQPGFLDHWKTRLLVQLAGDDERAILAVLRLWEFCQMRKKWRFNGEITNAALDSICRLHNSRELFIKSGFLDEIDDKTVEVHDWAVENRYIVNCWTNGGKGGRKPSQKTKKPTGNPRVPERKPKGNPYNLILSNLISSLEEGVRGRFEEWVKVRKGMGKPVKDWDGMFTEQVKWLGQFSEKDQVEVLSASIRNNWQGLFPPKQDSTSPQRKLPAYEIEKRVKAIVAARNQIYDRWRGKEKEMSLEDRRQMNELQKKRDELEGQLTQ